MAMDFLAPSAPKMDTKIEKPWKILIVDDDYDVHEVTKIAITGCGFEERPFELLHAMSAEEAQKRLAENDDIAVALIDVVMESDTAGLKLVRWIRDELNNRFTRLILRTGQPGYAPQTDVIMKYDIDGYAEKAELSRAKLLTAIVTALRGYKLLQSLDTNRKNLKKLNDQFKSMVQKNSVGEFSDCVLAHLTSLVGKNTDCALFGAEQHPGMTRAPENHVRIHSALGILENQVDQPLGVLNDLSIRGLVKACFETGSITSDAKGTVLPLETRNGMSGALYIGQHYDALENSLGAELIQLFVANAALGYEKIALLEHIRSLAYVDRVTGLSTFSGFLEAFQRNQLNSRPLMVIHCDIQRFRVVADGLGDDKANEVLRKVGHRLSQIFPEVLCIARKERDEFLVLIDRLPESGIQDIVSRVEEAFQEPIRLDDGKLTLRLRLGFAFSADGNDTSEAVTRCASIALNDVRQKGNVSFAEFDPVMQDAAFERLRLASLLTEGDEQTEFSLHYQPIMLAKDESIVSLETLMRFRTPTGAFLDTARMIEAAETSGLISDIGAWMFKNSFFEFSGLEKLNPGMRLNVNLSPRQVHSNRIYKDIEDAAAAANLSIGKLVFEVTEGLFVNNDQATLKLLSWLRRQDARVVIDDFGTGYSSLSYLRKLPVDGIKIDRSFILNMDQDPDALAVVKSIVAVAQALDLRITAEGVETTSQRKIMQDLNCDYLQGYLYSKPIGSAEIRSFIVDYKKPNES